MKIGRYQIMLEKRVTLSGWEAALISILAMIWLWGEAGERQCTLPSGGAPQVGIAAAGGGPLPSSLLLTRS